MRNSTVALGVRQILSDALGEKAVDDLTPAALGRIIGAMFGAVHRELAQPNPDQLELAA